MRLQGGVSASVSAIRIPCLAFHVVETGCTYAYVYRWYVSDRMSQPTVGGKDVMDARKSQYGKPEEYASADPAQRGDGAG